MTGMATLPRKLVKLTHSANSRRRTPFPRPVPDDLVAAKLGYLREVEVFASLPASEQHWLVTNTTMVTCERGRIFYTPDEPGEVVFILKRGRVHLFRLTADGRKLILATLGEHTIFGEMGLIGQGMYGCYAEAADDCLLCVLSRSDLAALLRRNPDAALQLLEDIGTRLLEREAALEALAFRTVPARLASLLLAEADAYGIVEGESHQDLADRLGTHRETVSQILGRFRARGLVTVEPRHIRLLDPDGLRAIAAA